MASRLYHAVVLSGIALGAAGVAIACAEGDAPGDVVPTSLEETVDASDAPAARPTREAGGDALAPEAGADATSDVGALDAADDADADAGWHPTK